MVVPAKPLAVVHVPVHEAPTAWSPVQAAAAPGTADAAHVSEVQSADASFQYDEVLLRAVHVYVFVPAKPDPHMRELVCADEHVAPTEAALQAIRPAQSARIGHCGVAWRRTTSTEALTPLISPSRTSAEHRRRRTPRVNPITLADDLISTTSE